MDDNARVICGIFAEDLIEVVTVDYGGSFAAEYSDAPGHPPNVEMTLDVIDIVATSLSVDSLFFYLECESVLSGHLGQNFSNAVGLVVKVIHALCATYPNSKRYSLAMREVHFSESGMVQIRIACWIF